MDGEPGEHHRIMLRASENPGPRVHQSPRTCFSTPISSDYPRVHPPVPITDCLIQAQNTPDRRLVPTMKEDHAESFKHRKNPWESNAQPWKCRVALITVHIHSYLFDKYICPCIIYTGKGNIREPRMPSELVPALPGGGDVLHRQTAGLAGEAFFSTCLYLKDQARGFTIQVTERGGRGGKPACSRALVHLSWRAEAVTTGDPRHSRCGLKLCAAY